MQSLHQYQCLLTIQYPDPDNAVRLYRMLESKRIKTALVSVYHKEGLDEIITKLHEEGVEFLSTGGTRQFIE